MLDEPTRYRMLKLLQERPRMSQREISEALGVSLGKANYCLRALIEKGLVKAANFRGNPNKRAYAYFLTPQGIEEKAQTAVSFLKRKLKEHEELTQEIEQLRRESQQG